MYREIYKIDRGGYIDREGVMVEGRGGGGGGGDDVQRDLQ